MYRLVYILRNDYFPTSGNSIPNTPGSFHEKTFKHSKSDFM